MIENLKVGDVIKDPRGDKYRVEEVFANALIVKCLTANGVWIRLKEDLKDYTLVQPEKTLEEKFEEYRDDEEGIDCAYRCIVDLAQIAEEHYKELKK